MNIGFRGDRLAALRKTKRMTQAELAEALEISQNQISTYERGLAYPTLSTVVKMANLFDTTADYLVGMSNVPEREAEPEPYVNQHEADILDLMRSRSSTDQAKLVKAIRLLWEED